MISSKLAVERQPLEARERRRRPVFSSCTISLRFLRTRTAVSPKMVRMLSMPRPRTSRKSLSSSGLRPSSVSGRDVVELDHVVGHQSAAARDQLERQLALAHAAVAGEQHAHAEHVEQHAVARDELGQRAAQIGAHHPDDLQARQRRCDQRHLACAR